MTESMFDRAHDASTWVFDVDATLLDGMSATSLRPGAQELLTLLSSNGRRIMVWSAGGEDYARRRLLAMGIIGFFEAVHDKGDRGDDRCYDTLRVVPAHELSAAIFVDDQPRDLPPRATVLAVRPYLAANAHDRELHRLHDAMRVRLDAATAAASVPTAARPDR